MFQRMSLACVVLAATSCVPPPPVPPPPPPRPRPPFLYACRPEFRCDDSRPREITAKATVPLHVRVFGVVGPSAKFAAQTEGHEIELRDRAGQTIGRTPVVDDLPGSSVTLFGELHPFTAVLDLAPGDYRADLVGRDLRMIMFDVRVARVKMLDASSRIAVYVHRGTRVWLKERALTVGRFYSLDNGPEPVVVEWERDGVVVARDEMIRGAWPRPGERATPWRFGETFKLPRQIPDETGHWIARIHTPRDSVEIAFDIRDRSLAITDSLAEVRGAVSPPLYVQPVASRPEITAAVQRAMKPTPELDDRGAFAPRIPASPEMVRALTRDRGLASLLGEFESIRAPRSVGRVEIDKRRAAEMSPEQRWRYQRRADRDASNNASADNRRNRVRAPKLRAAILARIAAHGTRPFGPDEQPR